MFHACEIVIPLGTSMIARLLDIRTLVCLPTCLVPVPPMSGDCSLSYWIPLGNPVPVWVFVLGERDVGGGIGIYPVCYLPMGSTPAPYRFVLRPPWLALSGVWCVLWVCGLVL